MGRPPDAPMPESNPATVLPHFLSGSLFDPPTIFQTACWIYPSISLTAISSVPEGSIASENATSHSRIPLPSAKCSTPLAPPERINSCTLYKPSTEQSESLLAARRGSRESRMRVFPATSLSALMELIISPGWKQPGASSAICAFLMLERRHWSRMYSRSSSMAATLVNSSGKPAVCQQMRPLPIVPRAASKSASTAIFIFSTAASSSAPDSGRRAPRSAMTRRASL